MRCHILLRLCCVHSDGGSDESSFVSHFFAEFQPESDKDQARSQKTHCSSSPPPPLLLLHLSIPSHLPHTTPSPQPLPPPHAPLLPLSTPHPPPTPPSLPPPSPPPPPTTDLYLRMQSCEIQILFLNMKVNSEDLFFSKRGSKKNKLSAQFFSCSSDTFFFQRGWLLLFFCSFF